MNLEIILNVIIAMFLYNIFLKAIGVTILKNILSNEQKKELRKTFKEKLQEKMEQRDKKS